MYIKKYIATAVFTLLVPFANGGGCGGGATDGGSGDFPVGPAAPSHNVVLRVAIYDDVNEEVVDEFTVHVDVDAISPPGAEPPVINEQQVPYSYDPIAPVNDTMIIQPGMITVSITVSTFLPGHWLLVAYLVDLDHPDILIGSQKDYFNREDFPVDAEIRLLWP